MSKSFKHDLKWAEAKKRCGLNQDDIAKAKALGLSPKSLIKNIPSPSQKWKQPVKLWVRELYERKFGGTQAVKKSGTNSNPPKKSQPAFPSVPPESDPREFLLNLDDDEEDWISDEVDEFDDGPPKLAIEEMPKTYYRHDSEWGNHRYGRRQVNLRWAAAALSIRLAEIEAIDAITLFGSVAIGMCVYSGESLWEDPPTLKEYRDVDLALAIKQCDDAGLRAITNAVIETLSSLGATELITLTWNELDLHLIDAGSNTFLGKLRPIRPTADHTEIATSYRLDNTGFKLRPATNQALAKEK
jgi:hypothetical protein